MTTDFDFDGTFDDDADNEGFPDEDEDEQSSGRRNPRRLILLGLVILVLLCLICTVAYRFLPGGLIPGIGGPPPATNTPVSEPTEAPTAGPTVVIEPTDETQVPSEPSEEPTAGPTVVVEPTEEAQVPTEPAEEPTVGPTVVVEPTEEPTVGPTVVVEPTEEPTLVAEPTDVTVGEHDEEPVEATVTTVPVPGPTATPGPTVVVTVTTCDNNSPPVADANGPYNAMMGKGEAIVTFDGSNSTDSDGTIVDYDWDFDDGSDPENGESVTHGYTSTGSFVVTLIVTDDCGASSLATAEVTIVGPTPPAGTSTPVVPTPSPEPPPVGTLGFCYRVQYGDTLSGIAWRFGVSWQDLAYVNKVGMGYFVIAGQGIFIPVGPITDGPNIYEVQAGDTLNSVAYYCGLTAATLARVNGLNLGESLSPGQMLMIPPWRFR